MEKPEPHEALPADDEELLERLRETNPDPAPETLKKAAKRVLHYADALGDPEEDLTQPVIDDDEGIFEVTDSPKKDN